MRYKGHKAFETETLTNMSKQILCAFFAVGCLMMFSLDSAAQGPPVPPVRPPVPLVRRAPRVPPPPRQPRVKREWPSVSAAEVTGTFSHRFGGKFKGSSSDIEILSVGKGRLKVAFDLIYPFADGNGEMSANMGQADGEAAIKGDTAIFRSSEFGQCTITIKFVRPGIIKVTQGGTENDCGFGHNVMADGTYRKTSSKRPKLKAVN